MRNLSRKSSKTMTLKTMKAISAVISVIGFLLILGAIGGCDRGSLDIGRALLYVASGAGMSLGGILGIMFFNNFDD